MGGQKRDARARRDPLWFLDNGSRAGHPAAMTLILVAAGGALGASLRYLTFLLVAFPFGTLTVNVVGSFLMGLAFVALADKGMDRMQPLVMTGVLGGFTTFSAFSLDAVRLMQGGQAALAVGYVVGSVVLSLGAVVLGVYFARGIGL